MKLNPLHNQVGGHDGVLSMGDDNEIIVKPVLPQELRFYEESVLHPELQTWMPAYYGTLTLTRQQPDSQLQDGQNAMPGLPTIKALNGYALTDLLSFDQAGQAQNGSEAAATAADEASKHVGDENDDECICLENISRGFSNPCVLDLKLGTQLYDDDASDEKKARLGAVAATTTTGKLGLRLTGFHVYDSDKREFIKYSKHYGKGLNEDNVLDGFRAFFAAKLGSKRMRLVIERFINDLTDFLATIETQELRMRSSSLLMMYEGDAEMFDEALLLEQEKIASVVARAKATLTESNDNDSRTTKRQTAEENGEAMDCDDDDEYSDDDDEEDDDELAQKVTDMRLIDFGHSTWVPGQGPDEGVILGVKSALTFFERLLDEDYPSEE
ncbi:hypothetical protein BGZ99_007796 [Dissophora globulifera]|uniref:Kinase n=1 Tax=Dissophora globulifera TaxID=979702 RepID=A0A9P6UQ95_9FUNG|nr:hypothetical protein BGZ99_007796 [Dissophora globulifera]